ncbi:MAG: alpha/beta hydrolase, partial [Prolixibacteraceae bacterium]|nr:alpha/beta hydrolase [Prolixibacteraceae bacterium]
HPYLDRESTVQSVIDMLMAVKELAVYIEVDLNDELYLTGYSQGGWTTMQLQKAIEEKYSAEFNLKASAPSAGPYDLGYINEYITGLTTYPMPYFLGYVFDSYDKLDAMTTPVEEIFREPYASKIPGLYDGSKSGEEINAELTTSVNDLFTAGYLNNYKTDAKYSSLLEALENNSIGAWNTNIPTRIIHGTADEFVPFQISQNIYNEFQEKGINKVTLIPIPDAGHTDGIIPAGLLSIGWFLELTE